MGEDDVKTFEKLIDKGITFDVRKVPADSAEDINKLIAKAKSELNMA